MDYPNQKIIPVRIEEEMKSSYIDYSMSVIVSRALPDVRDGLKPVHRRILVAMNDLSLYHDRPYRKSAKITGDVTGNYHPHGTVAVYDALVRLVQEFSLRHPLIDGQGNFGSVDGDAPAAERYTEARLSRIAEEILADLEKDTVDFRPNYDESREEPVVLPSRFPNLIVNGASGIAVGMATNIPPHNLGETVDAIVHLIENPEATVLDLMQFVKGPDFPTAAMILGRKGIRDYLLTGRGLVTVRARAEIDEIRPGKDAIIVTEIPYQVNKASMIERIAELVKSGSLSGISDVRDESDRNGMRVVIELKREAQPQVVLNQLYKHTQMQTTFGANMLALNHGRPQVMNLKQFLEAFIEHRHEVIIRRSRFELAQAEKRAHILEGLRTALDHIDAIITLIRSSADVETARQGLISQFGLTEIQANAILEMRLQRLTGLERQKIEDEYAEVMSRIADLKETLASRAKVLLIIKGELLEQKENHADPRRTEILDSDDSGSFDIEDLIPDEDVVITISHSGYIKRVSKNSYRAQNRGGKGLTAATTKDEDFIEHLFIASTHSYLLLFTDRGRVYWLKVHEIPVGTRQARGRSILNLVMAAKDERVNAFVPVRRFTEDHFLMLVTQSGTIKKTSLVAFGNPRKAGIIAIDLDDNDILVDAALTDGQREVVIATRKGKAIRFNETTVRPMGRTAGGVRGVSLDGEDDRVVGMVVVKDPNETLLVVTENGYGKRSALEDYRITNRGGMGIITMVTSERNGCVVAIKGVTDRDELMIMSTSGLVIRLEVAQISVLGRATQGVKLIQIEDGDTVADVAHLAKEARDETVSGALVVESATGAVDEDAGTEGDGSQDESMDEDERSSDPEGEA
ncbi:MAG: DNA gyrase subunit A [Candidatus Eisenbacteria bacterium]|nr:DNA gyrase subunit A [Candidatus Eisenbacteria bacterium]MCC7140747.1 DNA gyrase subunit A [Candidatus Eisenbacteria bacterium]